MHRRLICPMLLCALITAIPSTMSSQQLRARATGGAYKSTNIDAYGNMFSYEAALPCSNVDKAGYMSGTNETASTTTVCGAGASMWVEATSGDNMLRFRFNFEATRIDTFYLLYTDVCGLTGTEAWVGIYPGWLVNSTTCTVTGGLDCIPNIVFGHQLTFNLSAGIVIDSMHGLNTCSNTCAVRELNFSPVSAELVGREIPNTVLLSQNYPNPFNPSTTIRYGLPSRSHVTLTVFSTLGQQVATLVHGEQEAGFHEAVFDASGMASGAYLYRLQAGDFVSSKTMLILQ